MMKRFDDKARSHERLADKRESDVVAMALRLVEHLLETDHALDAIERTVVGWMQARSLAPRESYAVAARLRARLGNAAFVRADEGVAAWRRRATQDQAPSPGIGQVATTYRADTQAARLARFDGAVATERQRIDAVPARWRLPPRDPGIVAGAVVPMEHRQPGIYAIQRAPSDASGPGRDRLRDVSPEAILARLGAGRPLPDRLRQALEPRLEALGQPVDLARVRVHDDVAAEILCAELGADAFAVVHHVVVASPLREDSESMAVLAHELTHVWQQLRGDAPPGVDTHAHLETRAEAAADGMRRAPLFATAHTSELPADPHVVAAEGATGAGVALPFRDRIQASFGRFDVSGARAHVDADARAAAATLGAEAYASGSDVVFGTTPSLFTAAHEAAHVVQQRSGVAVPGGLGRVGDVYEQHADRVAAAVIAGRPAEPILAEMAAPTGRAQPAVQLQAAAAPAATTETPAETPAPTTEEPAADTAPDRFSWRSEGGRVTLPAAVRTALIQLQDQLLGSRGPFSALDPEALANPRIEPLLIDDARVLAEQACEGQGPEGYQVASIVDPNAELAVGNLMAEVARQMAATPDEEAVRRRFRIQIRVAGPPLRNLSRQKALFAGAVRDRGSVTAAQRYSALPGYSQHHTGKAFDVVSATSLDWGRTPEAGETAPPAARVDLFTGPIASRIRAIVGNYGGRVSYPEEDNNGRAREPWHLYFEDPNPSGVAPSSDAGGDVIEVEQGTSTETGE